MEMVWEGQMMESPNKELVINWLFTKYKVLLQALYVGIISFDSHNNSMSSRVKVTFSGLQRYQFGSLTSESIFSMTCYCRCPLYIPSLPFILLMPHRNMEHFKILNRKMCKIHYT